MFVLQKLILAHLIADFVLQFEELYQLKLSGRLGHVIHASFHGLVCLLLLWPYLTDPSVWLAVAGITALHLLQDLWKYARMGNRRTFFALFVWDQLVHLACLALVLPLPFSRQALGFPDSPALDRLYREPAVTILGIAFLATTFAGSYLLHALRTSALPDSRPDHFITSSEMAHGFAERLLIVGALLFAPGPWALVLVPAAGLLRLPFPRLRSLTDYALNAALSAALGLLFRPWLGSGV
jgi:hypothetical protein